MNAGEMGNDRFQFCDHHIIHFCEIRVKNNYEIILSKIEFMQIYQVYMECEGDIKDFFI